MLLADLSGQLLAPYLLEKVLSVPILSTTPLPPPVQQYPLIRPTQSAQTFFFAMSSLYRLGEP